MILTDKDIAHENLVRIADKYLRWCQWVIRDAKITNARDSVRLFQTRESLDTWQSVVAKLQQGQGWDAFTEEERSEVKAAVSNDRA